MESLPINFEFGSWPYAPSFKPDELLSSYLVRTAYAHGCSPSQFVRKTFGSLNSFRRDIDYSLPFALQIIVSKLANAPLQTIAAMSLSNLNFLREAQFPPRGRLPWVIPIGIRGLRAPRGGSWCPECLAEAPPFLRRKWRIAQVTVCAQHECWLEDACEDCSSPVNPFLANKPTRVGICQQCFAILSRQLTRRPEYFDTLARIQNWLLSCRNANQQQWIRLPGIEPIDVLQTFRILISVAASVPTFILLSECFDEHRTYSVYQNNPNIFEHLSVVRRAEILLLIDKWISEWPQNFRIGANAARLTQRSFARRVLPDVLSIEVAKLPVGQTRNRISHRQNRFAPPELYRTARALPVFERYIRAQELLKMVKDDDT